MKTKRHRAFSLLELLVVVAVLALLTLLLWPIFRRISAYRNYNDMLCMNNMKQVALGVRQYLKDFNGHYPLVVVTDAAGTTYTAPYGWADALIPYIKNPQVLQCYDDANAAQTDSGAANFSDYWYNANFIVAQTDKKGGRSWTGASDSALGSAAQTILLGEGGNITRTPTGNARYNQCGDGKGIISSNQTCPLMPQNTAIYSTAQMYMGEANYAFADGHIKCLTGTSPTQCSQVLNNGATRKTIGGKYTFSLLTK